MLWLKGFRKNLRYLGTREPRWQFLSAIKIFPNLASRDRFAVCSGVFFIAIAFRVVDYLLKRYYPYAYLVAVLLNQLMRFVRPVKGTIPRVGAWARRIPAQNEIVSSEVAPYQCVPECCLRSRQTHSQR